ncbi:MAG TPA: alpha/beta hydrolase [Microbacterium sp.]|uniref:alpha/beta fold hydrolase n=1 Tax=Microbacterium sp. TaxID=51671 RepID=UPI002CB28027|nr:alpha/beta hydrolase [Microbacterium sp.]HWI30497.1 alpha/beta hydrolase [Microbacterium sp.]
MTLFTGITQRVVNTPGLSVGILEREGDAASADPTKTVVLIHDNIASSLFWMPLMLALPRELRVIAIDLRGFGATEHAPVDATRGVRDFSDDIRATLDALGIPTTHLVGWSLGAAVALQYALEHPTLSLTLESPVSPYGFGGTRRDGSRLTDDDAGTGAGAANPDFVQRITDRDESDEAPTSPRTVFRASYVADGYADDHEDVWVESMLSSSTATGNYPGDSVNSENWPGFAPGRIGVLNTLSPAHFNVSGIVALDEKPPILWVRGELDAIVSDASFFDVNHLGRLGIVPDWPGEDVAPAQPMVSQTRDVLQAYASSGGAVTEAVFEGVGHTPHLERPEEFRDALVAHISAVHASPATDPNPPTEAFIIKSED